MPKVIARNEHDEHLILRDKTDRREARMRTRYERKLADLRINKEVELSSARFHEVDALLAAHNLSHEREHIATAQSISIAAETLRLRLDMQADDIHGLQELARTHMTVERFEREHKLLADRLDDRWNEAQAGIRGEENVTLRQTTSAEATKEILSISRQAADASATNRRWLIGISVGLVFSIVGLLITLFSLLEHENTI
jgi:cytochrome c-type biogenesis protein CcmH/NrfG